LASDIKGRTETYGILEQVLRRTFRPKKDEIIGDWRELHNEEPYNLYSLPNIIIMMKSRKITWAGHGAQTGEKRNAYMVLVGKPEGKNH
jgi:hypothetical protein